MIQGNIFDPAKLFEDINRIRLKNPLIHHLTNWVTIYDCAQVTRATGALPVMAHAREEVEEMVSIASALVINIGTLTKDFIDSSLLAAKRAQKKGIPVVLDAVGAGATNLRTESALQLLNDARISVLKGNAGEIATLAGAKAEVKGVESIDVEGDTAEHGRILAERYGCTVAITGPKDTVTDGKRTAHVLNGHPLMGQVVGTGCMVTSVIGCFVAVNPDSFRGSVHALTAFGIAGEKAAITSNAPMEFKMNIMDAMTMLIQEDAESMRVIP